MVRNCLLIHRSFLHFTSIISMFCKNFLQEFNEISHKNIWFFFFINLLFQICLFNLNQHITTIVRLIDFQRKKNYRRLNILKRRAHIFCNRQDLWSRPPGCKKKNLTKYLYEWLNSLEYEYIIDACFNT